jgi:folylpolyglutamate synthase/dihydropteroate synthase
MWRRAVPGATGLASGVVSATPGEALTAAAALPGPGPVLVAGSLYLVGAVRAALTGRAVDA